MQKVTRLACLALLAAAGTARAAPEPAANSDTLDLSLEDLMQVVMASVKDGAKIDYKTEGEVQIAMWQLPKSPMNMVCGQTGKSVALRIALEPDHKDIALAMCKSLRVEK